MSLPDYKPEDYEEWTGEDSWNAVYTISLGELIENDIFDWKSALLDWSKAAYSDEQYSRVCEYFIERFRFREISIEPYWEWATILHRKIVWELMPKYRRMYQMLDDKFDFAQDHYETSTEHGNLDRKTTGTESTRDNETKGTTGSTSGSMTESGTEDTTTHTDAYGKSREVESQYPETLLSGNSDYASDGTDSEHEDIEDGTKAVKTTGTQDTTGTSKEDWERSETIGRDKTGTQNDDTWNTFEHTERGPLLDKYLQYEQEFQAIDKSLLDQLECMFVPFYSVSLNGM